MKKYLKGIILILLTLSWIVLTGCSTRIVKVEYIKPEIPGLPAKPEYSDVEWQRLDDKYCLDTENARKLLMNHELMKSYLEEIEEILRSLKEDGVTGGE